MAKTKSFKVDFYVLTVNQIQGTQLLKELLESSEERGCTEAFSLNREDDEKYQIRNIVKLGAGASYKGIFGRCRYNETPVQGTVDGKEEDVEIKPGHGLVEKNHFLFFPNRNLLVYQRNSGGSHYSKMRSFLELATEIQGVTLEPILTKDSYAKLLSSNADVRRIDLSFQKPKDPSLYSNAWTREAMQLMRSAGSVSSRVTLSVGREGGSLSRDLKNAVVTLAKGGLASVARVKLEGELEPIDLIGDRVIENATVPLEKNGRPAADEIYAALDRAKSKKQQDIDAFFC